MVTDLTDCVVITIKSIKSKLEKSGTMFLSFPD